VVYLDGKARVEINKRKKKVSDLMDSLKTLRKAKTADVDKVLLGWFMQYLDEKFPPCHCLS